MGVTLAVDNNEVEFVDSNDYKELYYAAFDQLTSLNEAVKKAQQGLEDLFIRQSESTAPSLTVLK